MSIALRTELCYKVVGKKKSKRLVQDRAIECGVSGKELWVLQELFFSLWLLGFPPQPSAS